METEVSDLRTAETEATNRAADLTIEHREQAGTWATESDNIKSISDRIVEANRRLDRGEQAIADLADTAAELDRYLGENLPRSWSEADGVAPHKMGKFEQLCEKSDQLPRDLDEARRARDRADDADRAAAQALQEAKLRVANIKAQISAEEATAKSRVSMASSCTTDLAEGVQLDFVERGQEFLTELTVEAESLSDAPQQLEALQAAEEKERRAANEVETLTSAITEIPMNQQLSVDSARSRLKSAEETAASALSERDDARDALRELKESEMVFAEISAQCSREGRSAALAARLAKLLGRSGLQGELVRQAIGGVEDLANETLGRVSGGTLSLSLQVDNTSTSRTLEIYVTDETSADEPLEAAFVSGSQRFRVAVALAAGLGQFVGGRDAVSALIIDEGFGSLDEGGREEMIHELNKLADQLEKIIVVSHHNDFSDPVHFPHSFHLSKVEKVTSVVRKI